MNDDQGLLLVAVGFSPAELGVLGLRLKLHELSGSTEMDRRIVDWCRGVIHREIAAEKGRLENEMRAPEPDVTF